MPAPVYSVLTGGGTSTVTQPAGRSRRGQEVDQASIDKIIHLSGFPFTLSERGLVELCSDLKLDLFNVQYAVHTTGSMEGRSRGFAWLEFKTANDAQAAMKKLNGLRLSAENTLVAQPYVPAQQNTQMMNKGFANLKHRTHQQSNPSATPGHDNTSTKGDAASIDGVSIKNFLKIVEILDDVEEDDLVPIFGLPPTPVRQDSMTE